MNNSNISQNINKKMISANKTKKILTYFKDNYNFLPGRITKQF
jgi:hypothetical protein